MSSVRALFVAFAALSIAACSGSEPAPQASSVPERLPAASAPPPSTSSPTEMRADLPPLPLTPAARPLEVVRAVFTFAADHPEVLSKMPCFCGCENRGHKHNDDCFVTARDARGRVTAWEPHGVGWGICLDVAREAMQLHNSGVPLKSIRETIEGRYRATFPTMTPTPPIK